MILLAVRLRALRHRRWAVLSPDYQTVVCFRTRRGAHRWLYELIKQTNRASYDELELGSWRVERWA